MATTTPTTPRTLLDAVNALLQAIRVSNVMSLLDTDLNDDASAAREALDAAAIGVMEKGYSFNTNLGVTLDPNVDGEIVLPEDCLKVRNVRCSWGDRLVQRGQRLYNPTEAHNTFVIAESVKVDMVVALVFEDLPSVARRFITASAARSFCIPRLPSGATFQYTEEFLKRAEGDLEAAEVETLDTDLKQTSSHFTRMGRR